MDLRYPIGPYQANAEPTAEELTDWKDSIASFPAKLEALVEGKTEELSWPYRPGGWTIREVVHHCVDSHMNSLVRFKWALTEDEPTIKTYREGEWAQLADGQEESIEGSLALLQYLHRRWSILLQSLSPEQLERRYIHPEHGRAISVKETIGLYRWHCEHHLGHVGQGLESGGKYVG